jgi:hypothetical protein
MKPVMQTVFATEEKPKQGDCFRACIASLLELAIDDVPDFCAEPGNWEDRLHAWLGDRGLATVEINFGVGQTVYPVTDGTVCIVSGTTARHPTRLHSIIGRVTWDENRQPIGAARPFLVFEFLHDPHPDGSFLQTCETANFIFAKDPMKS